MTDTPAIELAKRYFELSNNADLAAIAELFTDSSTYSSVSTGVYLGGQSIMQMQRAFFADNSALRWSVNSVEEIRPGVVLFDFTLTGEGRDGGKFVRHGIEYVIVHNGCLQHVEVRAKASA